MAGCNLVLLVNLRQELEKLKDENEELRQTADCCYVREQVVGEGGGEEETGSVREVVEEGRGKGERGRGRVQSESENASEGWWADRVARKDLSRVRGMKCNGMVTAGG